MLALRAPSLAGEARIREGISRFRTLAGRPNLETFFWSIRMAILKTQKRHPLENGCPPAWASAWGQDRYGVWVEFRVGQAAQRMRWIMPGRFRMGSPDDDGESFDREKPAHEVVISRGYWLFDTPCCQDMWEAVLGTEANQSHFRGARRPVENVSWDEAVRFTEKLNELIRGLGIRLPREAEWEYACRAGILESRYGALDEAAWYDKNSGNESHDVGRKLPNGWGLYDMLGNVWEWCLDGTRDYSTDHITDPDGGRSAGRVIRGGSWAHPARSTRAAFRTWRQSDVRDSHLGFRCLSSGMEEQKEQIEQGESEAERALRAREIQNDRGRPAPSRMK